MKTFNFLIALDSFNEKIIYFYRSRSKMDISNPEKG